jgi:hypothetical protein
MSDDVELTRVFSVRNLVYFVRRLLDYGRCEWLTVSSANLTESRSALALALAYFFRFEGYKKLLVQRSSPGLEQNSDSLRLTL